MKALKQMCENTMEWDRRKKSLPHSTEIIKRARRWKMRFFSRSVLSLAENMTSLGGPMMIANATSIFIANATFYDGPFTDPKSIQQTLAYVWVVFLSTLLGCIIITTVLGKCIKILPTFAVYFRSRSTSIHMYVLSHIICIRRCVVVLTLRGARRRHSTVQINTN